MRALSVLHSLYAAGVHGHGDTLKEDIEAHRQSGWAIIEDDFVILFRLCGLDWPIEKLRNPSQSDDNGALCWVWCVAGDLEKAFKAAVQTANKPVTHIGYDRRGIPRLIPFERFIPKKH